MTAEARYEPEPLLQLAARVRRVARALVADENEAQDLEQATWRRALEHPDTPPNGPWLSAIARNLARTGWRAAGRAPVGRSRCRAILV